MRALLALVALLVTLALPQDALSNFSCAPSGPTKGTVLAIHGGAFLWGDAEDLRPYCDPLNDLEYRMVSVNYPYDLRSALAEIRNQRRATGARYALGVSAGGFYAAHINVEHAVLAAPVTDLVHWGNSALWDVLGVPSEWERAAFSQPQAPTFKTANLIHDKDDPYVPYEQSVWFAREAGPSVRLLSVRGYGHALPPGLVVWASGL